MSDKVAHLIFRMGEFPTDVPKSTDSAISDHLMLLHFHEVCQAVSRNDVARS